MVDSERIRTTCQRSPDGAPSGDCPQSPAAKPQPGTSSDELLLDISIGLARGMCVCVAGYLGWGLLFVLHPWPLLPLLQTNGYSDARSRALILPILACVAWGRRRTSRKRGAYLEEYVLACLWPATLGILVMLWGAADDFADPPVRATIAKLLMDAARSVDHLSWRLPLLYASLLFRAGVVLLPIAVAARATYEERGRGRLLLPMLLAQAPGIASWSLLFESFLFLRVWWHGRTSAPEAYAALQSAYGAYGPAVLAISVLAAAAVVVSSYGFFPYLLKPEEPRLGDGAR